METVANWQSSPVGNIQEISQKLNQLLMSGSATGSQTPGGTTTLDLPVPPPDEMWKMLTYSIERITYLEDEYVKQGEAIRKSKAAALQGTRTIEPMRRTSGVTRQGCMRSRSVSRW